MSESEKPQEAQADLLPLEDITGPPSEELRKPTEALNYPDAKTELEIKRTELDGIKLEQEGRKQDIAERKRYAKLVYYLICAWLFLLFVLLGFQGAQGGLFHLDEKIVITLITGTTVNVLGIFFIVMNYLFPKK